MKLAINYSPEALKLLKAGRIEADLLKCRRWEEYVSADQAGRAGYLHLPLRAGSGRIGPADLDVLARQVDQSRTPHVNIHLTPRASDFPDMALETRAPADAERLAQAMLRDIGLLAERFGPDRVVLENTMWAPEPPWEIPRPAFTAEMIGRMVRESGCGFLLDLAHAAAAARFLGQLDKEYISALPTERLRELHVCGLIRRPDGVWDDHYAMTDDDWALTEWAVERIRAGHWRRPWVMTFEYGGVGPSFAGRSDADVIARQLPRLLALARSVNFPRAQRPP